VDTSGSTENMLPQFLAEMRKLNTLISELTVMTCDAEVHEVVKLTQMDGLFKNVKFKGGGGTDFRPVFSTVKEKRIIPDLLIYLTDMFGTFPEKGPNYPVLWVSTSGALTAP